MTGLSKSTVREAQHLPAFGEVPTARLEEADDFLQEDEPELVADAIKRVAAQPA